MPQEMRDYPLPIAYVFRNMDISGFEAEAAVPYPDRKDDSGTAVVCRFRVTVGYGDRQPSTG
jgi:hypothetical protein